MPPQKKYWVMEDQVMNYLLKLFQVNFIKEEH